MPAPVVLAARQYLVNSGALTDLIGTVIGRDAPGKPFDEGWIFSGDSEGKPFRIVEGTGRACVVLFTNGDWSPSSRMHTAQFPLLRVNIYADPDRDAGGQPTKHNAEDKVALIRARIHPLFHDAANRVHKFADLPIISTVEGGSFSIMEIPEGDGSVLGASTYEIAL